MADIKYSSGYGAESKLPGTIKEGQLLFSTDTRKVTLDADGQRIRFNPPGNWNEADTDSPAYINNKPDIDAIIADLKKLREIQGHMYGVVWDKTSSSMRRLFDSENITTDTTNFVYAGNVNPSYDNPFDDIYPWSECRQCNVDLDAYRALRPGQDIRDCVVSWFGDPDFATDGSNGFVGRYTPEFWHYGYEDSRGKIIVVSDRAVDGFIRHKASIRSHGFAVDDGNGGVTSNDGQPLTNVAVSEIHSRARAGGMTLEDIYEIDANVALYMVEFADTNSQAKLGDGCSNCYIQPSTPLTEATTNSLTVKLPASMKPHCIPGATLDFGASSGAVVLANRRTVVSVTDIDSDYIQVTMDKPLSTTTSMYPSIHGKDNSDSIGNKSGYVGTNTKNNAWYRGMILYANRYRYVLGAYRQTGTNHLWFCDPDTCDNYDTLNTSDHIDTGIQILTPSSNSWQNVGDYAVPEGKLSSFGPVTVAASVTGDAQYCVVSSTGNTVAFLGASANVGFNCGVLCALWGGSAGDSLWYRAGSLLLKSLPSS